MCKNTDIKELLPAYVGQELESAEAKTVEVHLAECEDCRAELSLLTLMAADEVPDPGPAFWAEMPGRIEREIRQRKKNHSLLDLLAGYLVPRWSWAPAAAAMVALVVWQAFRPLPADLPKMSSHEPEYAEPGEPLTVAELSPAQLAAASQWAQNQLAPIGRAIDEDIMDNRERDSSDDISDLNSEELDRLDKMLREREQELKKRIREKQRNDKNIG